jgi:hypothetical protein
MLKQHGYFFLDHRNSPGFTAQEAQVLARPVGSTVFEADTLFCKHCHTHVVKHPNRTREREFCRGCMHYVCDGCAWEMRQPGYLHAPFEKIVDDIQDGKLLIGD